MKIEIAGAGFLNKGAELMLRTTVARFRAHSPATRLAIAPGANSPYEQRASLGLAAIFPTPSLFPGRIRSVMLRSQWMESICTAPLRSLMPRRADEILGLVDRKNSDALVDISGYAYGDGFGWPKSLNAAVRSRSYARRGKPIIYLPQMFGPFTNRKVIEYFKRCCDEATRIYARDQMSLEALQSLMGDDPRIRTAPDITIFSADLLPIEIDEGAEPYACLVPNEKMLEKGSGEWGQSYLSRLQTAGCKMHEHGIRPIVVSHSSEDADARLADQLATQLEAQLGTGQVGRYSHEDPSQLKAHIGGARFLVGSRFHSIVAALSMGVPAILLGWAHKYDMLARDFGISGLQHRGDDSQEHLPELVARLADPEQNQHYRDIIAEKKAAMRRDAENMWDDVFSILFRDDKTAGPVPGLAQKEQ